MENIEKYELLWKLLRATTNSPNDIWTKEHFERHKNIPIELFGKPIYRYTVPIKYVGNILGEDIYLVIQFCTNELDYTYFVIDKNAFTKNLKSEKEFVYAFNVRLCRKSEFKAKRKKLIMKGEVKSEYRKEILLNSVGLIRRKPRWKSMMKLIDGKYSTNISQADLKNIIVNTQFTDDEKEYKGINLVHEDIDNE